MTTETYIITEPYDGSHVRILASARTPEAAMKQFDGEARARGSQGYGFFSPLRYIIALRDDVENELDQRLSDYPTWNDVDDWDDDL